MIHIKYPSKEKITHFVHDHVLCLSNEVVLRFDNSLKELQIFHVSAVSLNHPHEMLHHRICYFVTQSLIVEKNSSSCLRVPQLQRSLKGHRSVTADF